MDRALGLIEVIGYPPAIEAADAALKAANIRLGGITKVGSGIVTIQLFGDVGAIKAAVDAGGLSASRIGTVRATHVIPRVDELLFDSNIFGKDKNKTKLPIEENKPHNPELAQTSVGEKVTKINDEVNDTVNDAVNDTVVMKENNWLEESNKVNESNIDNESIKVNESKKINDSNKVIDNVKDTETNNSNKSNNNNPNNLVKENLKSNLHKENVVNDTILEQFSLGDIKKKSTSELKNIIQSLGKPISAKKLNSAKKEDLIQYITDYMDRKKGEV